MEKLKYAIAAVLLVLVVAILGTLVLNKKLEDDPAFVESIVNSKGNTVINTSSTDMKIQKKDVTDKGKGDYILNPETLDNDSYTALEMEAKLTKEEWERRINNGINSENLNRVDKENNKLYYYNLLSSFNKQLYLEILICLENNLTNISLCSTNADDVELAFNSVMADHPEIFYADGYLITRYSINDTISRIEFTPAFTMDFADRLDAQQYIEMYTEAFLAAAPQNTTEYEKIKFTYEFVILNTEYKLDSPENQNILSVMVNRQSVCQGYAKTFQYLMKKIGVECFLVVGTVGNGDSHAWNMVKCNDEYYYVDCTWGDSSYLSNIRNEDNIGGINYDYLNVTTQELNLTHTIDNFADVPFCNSVKYNYYVYENLYFTSVDDDQLSKAFRNAQINNYDSVEIKCANDFVYKEMEGYLMDEQHIFNYVPGVENITVYKNSDLKIYSFPLN